MPKQTKEFNLNVSVNRKEWVKAKAKAEESVGFSLKTKDTLQTILKEYNKENENE